MAGLGGAGRRLRGLADGTTDRRDGFGLTLAALLVFSGTQLLLLGLIGEYVGRMFLTVSQRPQAIVREVVSNHGHV